MTDEAVNPGEARFSQVIAEHVAAGYSYIDTVELVAGDLRDERAVTATRALTGSIDSLTDAHQEYVGEGIPWLASRPEQREDDEADGFDFPPEGDPIWTSEPEALPRYQEVPVYVRLGQVIAEGDWGVIRLRQAIVYESTVRLEVEQLRLRLPSENDDEWEALDMNPDRGTLLTFDGGRRVAEPAGGHGGGSQFDVRQYLRGFWLEGDLAAMDPRCEITMVVESDLSPIRFNLDLQDLEAAKASVRVL